MLDALTATLVFLVSAVVYVHIRYRRVRPDASEVLQMEPGDVVRNVWRLRQPFRLPAAACDPPSALGLAGRPCSLVDAATAAVVGVVGSPAGEVPGIGKGLSAEVELDEGEAVLERREHLGPTGARVSRRAVVLQPGGVWGTWLCSGERTYIVAREGSVVCSLVAPSGTGADIRAADAGTGIWAASPAAPAMAVTLAAGGSVLAVPPGWALRCRADARAVLETASYVTVASWVASLPELLRATFVAPADTNGLTPSA